MSHLLSKVVNILAREWGVLLPISLYLTNFVGLRFYWGVLIVAASSVILIDKGKRLVDLRLFILVLFSLAYLYFLSFHGLEISISGLFNYFIFPAAFYISGKYLAIRYPFTSSVITVILFLVFFQTLIPFFSNVIDVIETGFMTRRNIPLIWGGGVERAATGTGGYLSLNMAFFAVLFAPTVNSFETNVKKVILLLFLLALFSISNVITRTGFFIAGISVLALVITLKRRDRFKTIISLLIILVASYFLLLHFGILDWFSQSLLYDRFTTELEGADVRDLSTLPRTFRWQSVIEGFWSNPLGGKKTLIIGSYAHNLWLDVGWKAGLIPLFPLLIFTVLYIKSIYLTIASMDYSLFFRVLILSSGIGFILIFMVEPIMEGLLNMFNLWCLFAALTNEAGKNNFYNDFSH